jgi:hypothetical protein
LAITHTGANVHDSQQAIPLIDAIPPIKRPGGGRRKRPDTAFADRAYDAEEKIRAPLRQRGIKPLVAGWAFIVVSSSGFLAGYSNIVGSASATKGGPTSILHSSPSVACSFAGTGWKGFDTVPKCSLE